MKLTKFALALALGLVGIQQASADVTIHLVGSTAFRAAVVNSIINRLGSPTAIYSSDGTSVSGANDCVIVGTYSGLGTVTVECAWSGSVAGVQSATGGANIQFLQSGGTLTSCSVSGSVATGGTSVVTTRAGNPGNYTAALKPEVTMADNYQASTIYTSPTLNDTVVGIVPFAWVASANVPSGVTNVGPNPLNALFTQGGYLSPAVITGNIADKASAGGTDGTLIYAIGRDNGSGTRVNAFAEPGIGVFSNVAQARITTVANNIISHISLDTRGINGTTVAAGNGGESSGGTLADDIRNTTTSVTDDNNAFPARSIGFITYLGESDSYRAVAGNGSKVTNTNALNAHYLTYNGVSAFQGSFFNDVSATTSGSTTLSAAGSANPATAFVGIVPGQVIRGPNISGDCVVATVNSVSNPNTIVMSVAASGTSTTAKNTVANLVGTPIRNGSYTFWGYEHIMWDTSLSGNLLTFANALATQIATGGYRGGAVDSTNKGDYFAAGIANDSAVTVQRTTDGGPITALY